MTDLRQQLQSALGSAYTIERELGGGGMSRVFLAEERALGRSVVVKVLPPDVTAGVNADRFRREIQVSAKLQHPHIVPVLSTGEMDGVPWYTMPFVEGESLRHKLASAGALSITEAVGIRPLSASVRLGGTAVRRTRNSASSPRNEKSGRFRPLFPSGSKTVAATR